MNEKKTNKTQKTSLVISCPRCKQKCQYSEKNPYRPFCSKACSNTDFLDWYEESYKIAGEKTDKQDDSEEE